MNHYEVLGIKKTATQDDIKAAYKSLMKKYHPDIYKGNKEFAENMSKQINIAYDVLSNEESRQAYDEEISPKVNYTYTPPETDYSNSKYSYDNYKRTNSYGNSYDYYRKYRNYGNNTKQNYNPTSEKINEMHEEFSNNVISSFGSFSLPVKLLIIGVLLFAYITLIVTSGIQLNSLLSGKTKGTITKTVSNEENTTHKNTTSTQNKVTSQFNINDYYSDDELRSLYEAYYKDKYPNFYSFKKDLSDYLAYQFGY